MKNVFERVYSNLILAIGLTLTSFSAPPQLIAHEGHHSTTYRVTQPWRANPDDPRLRLSIKDDSGQFIAARFSTTVDGVPHIPSELCSNGLRFVSIHKGKRNTFIATYSRSSGVVSIPLPAGKSCSVTATRGFEYRPTTKTVLLNKKGETDCSIVIRRWIDLARKGWHATDEHVHFERTDRQHDSDWLDMLDADGLSHAHFLVLKGGNVPGIWAEQYAYGPEGEAKRKHQFIRSGEEYRDSTQGHINLLGSDSMIEPISTGGIGRSSKFNAPPLADVLREARRRGGIGGPAHGGALAKSSTALLDAVLGQVDFFEIANSHLYKTAIENGLNIKQNEIAHSGIIQVIVGENPICQDSDIQKLRIRLAQQQEHYRTQASYESAKDRERFMKLFEQAFAKLGI